MTSIPEETLLAYVDGELPPEEAARVAAALERDPDAAEMVRQFREASRLLAEAYDRPMREPAPRHLRDLLDRARPDSVRRDGGRQAGGARPGPLLRHALPLAASVALIVGLGGGYGLSRLAGPDAAPAPSGAVALAASPALQTALESSPSGAPTAWQTAGATSAEIMPLMTFRDESGRPCREYQTMLATSMGGETAYGIACRSDEGRWENRAVVAGPATASGEPAIEESFVPAAGEDPAAPFRRLIDEMIVGTALPPEAERQLLERDWTDAP